MPKKNRHVNMDANNRFRICVELCCESKQCLENLEAGFAQSDGEPGLSAITRAAIIWFWKSGEWDKAKLEKPRERDMRQKLRDITQTDQ